jgi:hypothetical protein
MALLLLLAGGWEWLNRHAAAAVVVVTAIYAFFTILLWRATQEQATLTRSAIDVQVRPFLVALPLRRGTETLDSFFVHNIGNGAALNIRLHWGSTDIAIPFLPRGACVQVLTLRETKEPRTSAMPEDHPYGRYELMVDDESARRGIALSVACTDVGGTLQTRTLHVGPEDAWVDMAP